MATLEDKYNELQDIKKAQSQAQDLYQTYVGGEQTLPTQLKSAINEKLNYSKPLIDQEASLREQQSNTATTFAAEMQGGRFAGNPILAGQAAAQREASIQRRLSEVSQMRQERTGTIADITQAATGAYGAQTERYKSAADIAGQRYSQASSEYQMSYQQHQDDLAAERQRQQDEYKKQQDDLDRQFQQQQFAFQKQQAAISNARSSSSGSSSKSSAAKSRGYSDTDLSKVADILGNSGLNVEPGNNESKNKFADPFLSKSEANEAVKRIQSQFGVNGDVANAMFADAASRYGFEEWQDTEAQHNWFKNHDQKSKWW
jgi:hypothetical protein